MQIFNDMTMKLEEFVPLEPGKVKMYACGPTVYNYIHVGNARPIIMFDVLRRYLEYRGYEVTFVQNFTDVDDKIINRAKEEGIDSSAVAEKYIAEYWKDVTALGVRPATVHPKATENIGQIIKLVKVLIEKGYAYEVNGDVYYRTLKFKDYGKLSHQPIVLFCAGKHCLEKVDNFAGGINIIGLALHESHEVPVEVHVDVLKSQDPALLFLELLDPVGDAIDGFGGVG